MTRVLWLRGLWLLCSSVSSGLFPQTSVHFNYIRACGSFICLVTWQPGEKCAPVCVCVWAGSIQKTRPDQAAFNQSVVHDALWAAGYYSAAAPGRPGRPWAQQLERSGGPVLAALHHQLHFLHGSEKLLLLLPAAGLFIKTHRLTTWQGPAAALLPPLSLSLFSILFFLSGAGFALLAQPLLFILPPRSIPKPPPSSPCHHRLSMLHPIIIIPRVHTRKHPCRIWARQPIMPGVDSLIIETVGVDASHCVERLIIQALSQHPLRGGGRKLCIVIYLQQSHLVLNPT